MMKLITTRVISFLFQLGTTIVVLIVGYLISPAFAQLVTEHFGTVVGGLVSLVIPEIVKHLRNVEVINAAADELGSFDAAHREVTLI